MARTSAADLAHSLKGANFPMKKKGLIDQARKNSAAKEILDTIQEMPDTEYGSLADVEHQFSQVSHRQGGGTSAASTGAARKGGQH